jgi:hypothetical protein
MFAAVFPAIVALHVVITSSALTVDGTATLPPLGAPSDRISFYLAPLMAVDGVTIADPKGVSVSSLSSEASGGDRRYTIDLSSQIATGTRVTLAFRYHSERNAPQFLVSSGGAFAGGSGELWYPQASFALRDTGSTCYQIPDGWSILATGIAQTPEGNTHCFRVDRPVKLAFAAAPYAVTTSSTQPPVTLYSLRARPNATKLANQIGGVLASMVQLWGPFPYGSYAIAEVQFPGNIVLGTGEYGFTLAAPSEFDRPFDAGYYGHEISHEWWGDAIRPKAGSSGEEMLTEGFAQYGALEAVLAASGTQSQLETLERGSSAFPNDSIAGYLRMAARGQDAPLDSIASGQTQILLLHHLATSKGMVVLYMLGKLLGEERFHSALRDFVTAHLDSDTTLAEVESAIAAGTQTNLTWFFDQWFRRTGAPRFEVTCAVQRDGAAITVRQRGAPYRLALPVELIPQGTGGQAVADPNGDLLHWPVPPAQCR